jgi:hypothetical protein
VRNKLSAEQTQLLRALAQGSTLKVHRDLDGGKIYKLHPLDHAPATVIDDAVVAALRKQGLIESNMKFPASVLLLTDKGTQHAASLLGVQVSPVGPRNYTQSE